MTGATGQCASGGSMYPLTLSIGPRTCSEWSWTCLDVALGEMGHRIYVSAAPCRALWSTASHHMYWVFDSAAGGTYSLEPEAAGPSSLPLWSLEFPNSLQWEQ
ncbi:hypothetical protein OH77DRAFT_1426648 [Trametes cingulata]|nr:hypothetical protein OH77DRAFT_1426648 [Trametes cingulata]